MKGYRCYEVHINKREFGRNNVRVFDIGNDNIIAVTRSARFGSYVAIGSKEEEEKVVLQAILTKFNTRRKNIEAKLNILYSQKNKDDKLIAYTQQDLKKLNITKSDLKIIRRWER